MSDPLLAMRDVTVWLRRGRHTAPVLEQFSLSVRPGEMLALVGESGAGKTIAALTMMRLLPAGAVVAGELQFDGEDVLALPQAGLRRLRGAGMGMVFQDAPAALNPGVNVGMHIAEAFRQRYGATAAAGRARALALMEEVGLDDAPRRARLYPHQLSGGMRRRVLIAAALSGNPKMLIADEPTAGLDSVAADQILALLTRLRARHGLSVLLISHDLSAVRAHADRVHVLYAGRSVEQAAAAPFFMAPAHPYSRALLGAAPRLGQRALVTIPGALPEPGAWPGGCRFAPRCTLRQPACDAAYPAPSTSAQGWAACLFPQTAPLPPAPEDAGPSPAPIGPVLLRVTDLGVRYRGPVFAKHGAPALAGVCFALRRGECLGVVGASGSGKTTLARAVLHMLTYDGAVALDGVAFQGLSRPAWRAQRRRIQAVFQDPTQSLNPVMRIVDIIAEPMKLAGIPTAARHAEAAALLARVGLHAGLLDRLPAEVSGGQAQRVAIARALAANPDVLVLDEPTSSLDVSNQAGVLMLVRALAAERGFATILISHDMAVVSFLADRIAVVAAGRVVDMGETTTVIGQRRHEVTEALAKAARLWA